MADLKGRKLAVAGGPIDKSWLLLQASMKQDGIDLKSEATIVYGAPPLLAAKTLDGEIDATINYWNFCAALEAKGFRRVAGIEDILPKLGAKGRIAMVGYVFDEAWASAEPRHGRPLHRHDAQGKGDSVDVGRGVGDDRAADGRHRCRHARVYRDRYREGIPRRPIADEEADARILYRVLADIGGRELVGPAQELEPGTYYHAIAGD